MGVFSKDGDNKGVFIFNVQSIDVPLSRCPNFFTPTHRSILLENVRVPVPCILLINSCLVVSHPRFFRSEVAQSLAQIRHIFYSLSKHQVPTYIPNFESTPSQNYIASDFREIVFLKLFSILFRKTVPYC